MNGPRAAYLHLPFCHRRCFYCDFPVVPLGDRADGARSRSIATYLDQLGSEIAASPDGPPLSTVYLGGGTPSMLTAEQVERLLTALRSRYGLAPGAEITMELDPAGFDRPRLAGYLAAGVNRVSLGGQSFDDGVLLALGRRHRARDLHEAAGWLRQARHTGELRSWSLDLIQGLPLGGATTPRPQAGTVRRHWRRQLEQAVAEEPPHLSVYDLIIEPGTVFSRQRESGALRLPDDDLAADLMEITWERLTAAGYGHYEISNYALPGHASRHNRVYWSGAGWWGFGMGATSAPAGLRRARPRTRAGYAGWLSRMGNAEPDAPDEVGGVPLEDRLLVGLRRREGVNLAALATEAAPGLDPPRLQELRRRLTPFERQGLLQVEGERWRLSDPAGLALSNAVLRELLAWWEEEGAPAEPRPRAGC
ncbi:MAG: coproporphyrinogen-III oxidase family protein [Synechococcaceae cyanobacterium]|nr:coproporphyrinogen-III oxidase family protein [Synechococcaceae cyanobacterium]